MSEALQCYICHVWTSLTTNHLCSRCYSDSRKIDHLIETLKKRDDENSALRVQLVQAQAARTICDVHQAEFDRLEEQLAAATQQLAQAEEEIACLNLQKEER